MGCIVAQLSSGFVLFQVGERAGVECKGGSCTASAHLEGALPAIAFCFKGPCTSSTFHLV